MTPRANDQSHGRPVRAPDRDRRHSTTSPRSASRDRPHGYAQPARVTHNHPQRRAVFHVKQSHQHKPTTHSVSRETSCTSVTSRTITDNVPRETITSTSPRQNKNKTKTHANTPPAPGRPPRPRPRITVTPDHCEPPSRAASTTTRPDEHRVSLSPWIPFPFISHPPPPPLRGGGYRSPAPQPIAITAAGRERSPSSPTTGGRLTPSTPGGPLRRARAPTCPRARSRARAKPTLRVGATVSTSPATPTTR